MAIDLPQFGYPLAFDDVDGLVIVEQDSPDEIVGCAHAILDTPKGWLDSEPEFGVDDLAFTDPALAPDTVRLAIERWEPRVSADVSGETAGPLDELITATLERASG